MAVPSLLSSPKALAHFSYDRFGTVIVGINKFNEEVLFEDDENAQSANFLIEVRKPNPMQGIFTLLGVMAFLGVLGLSARVYLKERKRGKN